MSDEGFDPLRIVATLRARGVSYVLTGGIAAAVHGSAIATADIEVCLADDGENLRRVGLALEDLVAVPSPREGDDDHRLTFDSGAGRFTIVEVPSGFEELLERSSVIDLGHAVVAPVAAVEDLVDLARASGDLEAAAHLSSFTESAADTSEPPDPGADKHPRAERMWSALERVDAFLSDLDSGKLRRRRDDD
jgi:hypothetical protein